MHRISSRVVFDFIALMVYHYCSNISSQEMKIEELKKINDRFRRQGESQKDVMDVLKSQVRTK